MAICTPCNRTVLLLNGICIELRVVQSLVVSTLVMRSEMRLFVKKGQLRASCGGTNLLQSALLLRLLV